MATAYPGAIDVLTNPGGGDNLNAPDHAAQHTNANDAIEAIETELGIDPAGAFATVVLRLDDVDTTNVSDDSRLDALESGTSGNAHPLAFYGLNMAMAG